MEEAFAGLTLNVRNLKVAADAVIVMKPHVARRLDFEDKMQYQRITLTAEQIDVKSAHLSLGFAKLHTELVQGFPMKRRGVKPALIKEFISS